MASAGKVLIIVQNLPVPFDRRVWLEASTLKEAGYEVSVICPTGRHGKFQAKHEVLDGVHIYRYPAPPEANGVLGYFFEFAYCWLMTAFLSLRIWLTRGLDVIHACNPPETYFLLGWVYNLVGKKLIFDHHDLSPEMYVAKGGKPDGILQHSLLWLERQTFKTADAVITTLRKNILQTLWLLLGPRCQALWRFPSRHRQSVWHLSSYTLLFFVPHALISHPYSNFDYA